MLLSTLSLLLLAAGTAQASPHLNYPHHRYHLPGRSPLAKRQSSPTGQGVSTGPFQTIPSSPKADGTFAKAGVATRPGLPDDTTKVPSDTYGVRDFDLPFGRLFHGNLNYYPDLGDAMAANDSASDGACGIPNGAWSPAQVAIHPYFLHYAGLDRYCMQDVCISFWTESGADDMMLKVTDICDPDSTDGVTCLTPQDIKINKQKAHVIYHGNENMYAGSQAPEKVWWFFTKCWADGLVQDPYVNNDNWFSEPELPNNLKWSQQTAFDQMKANQDSYPKHGFAQYPNGLYNTTRVDVGVPDWTAGTMEPTYTPLCGGKSRSKNAGSAPAPAVTTSATATKMTSSSSYPAATKTSSAATDSSVASSSSTTSTAGTASSSASYITTIHGYGSVSSAANTATSSSASDTTAADSSSSSSITATSNLYPPTAATTAQTTVNVVPVPMYGYGNSSSAAMGTGYGTGSVSSDESTTTSTTTGSTVTLTLTTTGSSAAGSSDASAGTGTETDCAAPSTSIVYVTVTLPSPSAGSGYGSGSGPGSNPGSGSSPAFQGDQGTGNSGSGSSAAAAALPTGSNGSTASSPKGVVQGSGSGSTGTGSTDTGSTGTGTEEDCTEDSTTTDVAATGTGAPEENCDESTDTSSSDAAAITAPPSQGSAASYINQYFTTSAGAFVPKSNATIAYPNTTATLSAGYPLDTAAEAKLSSMIYGSGSGYAQPSGSGAVQVAAVSGKRHHGWSSSSSATADATTATDATSSVPTEVLNQPASTAIPAPVDTILSELSSLATQSTTSSFSLTTSNTFSTVTTTATTTSNSSAGTTTSTSTSLGATSTQTADSYASYKPGDMCPTGTAAAGKKLAKRAETPEEWGRHW